MERRPAKFSNYAPLNVPRSRILDEVLQAELIPPPRKYQNPPNADLSKYCHYHRNNGHTTDECDTLRDKIEELVRAGHLKHYNNQHHIWRICRRREVILLQEKAPKSSPISTCCVRQNDKKNATHHLLRLRLSRHRR